MKKMVIGFATFALSAALCFASDEQKKLNEVQFGYNQSSGNTDTDSLIAKAKLQKRVGKWRHEARLEAVRSSEDGERTKENYIADLQTNRNYGDTHYAFANTRYTDDKFGGFRTQASLVVGMGWHVIASDRAMLDMELGLGERYSEEQETGDTYSKPIVLGQVKWRQELTESTVLSNDFRVEGGEDNTFIENETGARIAINSSLGLRVGYIVRHNTDVPVGTTKTDTLTAITLDYKF